MTRREDLLDQLHDLIAVMDDEQLEILVKGLMAPHAVELGRAGGKARAKAMTAEERSENAKNAVNARWAKKKERGQKPKTSA